MDRLSFDGIAVADVLHVVKHGLSVGYFYLGTFSLGENPFGECGGELTLIQ